LFFFCLAWTRWIRS